MKKIYQSSVKNIGKRQTSSGATTRDIEEENEIQAKLDNRVNQIIWC